MSAVLWLPHMGWEEGAGQHWARMQGLGAPGNPSLVEGTARHKAKGLEQNHSFKAIICHFHLTQSSRAFPDWNLFHWFQGSQTPTDFQGALTWSPTVPVLSTTVQHVKQASGRSKAPAVSRGFGMQGWVSWVVHRLVLQLRIGTAKSLQGFLCRASCATKSWPQTIQCSFSGK